MLRNIAQRSVLCFRISLTSHLRCYSKASNSATSRESWDLYAGVLVERLPIVSKALNSLEKQFQELLWRVEFENSLKSDFEMRHEREVRQAELIKKGNVEVDLDENASKQTAQDLRDAYTDELNKFTFASRHTPDDASNTLTSTNRCLEDTLYLLVEQTLGKETHLLLPQGIRHDGETLRQAAERIVREHCGNNISVTFYGNAPCGFYKYKYPKSIRNQCVGAKVFFYRATLSKGNVDKTKGRKFEWLTRTALEQKLTNVAYADSVQKFLL